ncbi:RNA-directed DNA polymerase [Teredinibacter turnerae]|uniref:RNA-directed DNA polymerase n=1 Tax=Teredinibacter turnerae TaxID=2426 RepID=UPI00042423DD|nr:RNA-directed DNA polymerase [Teredinibacter turnerae]
MKRTRIDLTQLADIRNLMHAFHKAAKDKRHRKSVLRFEKDLDNNLNRLSQDIVDKKLPYGRFRSFTIYDPKKRLIHAACFDDRVFHHAFMNYAAPVLEKAMSPTSYTCRHGFGVHQAIGKAQKCLRAFPYVIKIDIEGYFPAIPHVKLQCALTRKFKGSDALGQIHRIVNSHSSHPGHGLPIGSLTSQYFAIYYLDSLDRFMENHAKVMAQVRYMDDILWWCVSKQHALETLVEIENELAALGLRIKSNVQIQKSSLGVTFCGYRILQGALRLTLRKKRRYQQRRLAWEKLHEKGNITASQLQQAYAAVESICADSNSLQWRKCNLALWPPLEV